MAGINSTNSSLPRFWAGSSNEANSGSAPFRVYDDGRVFGTHFYGYNSATVINKNNYTQYLTNNLIDLTKTGNIIFLDGSLIDTTNDNLYLSINLKFPNNLQDYIGSELTIINPHKIPVNKCGLVMNPSYCTISDAFSQSSYTTLEKNAFEQYQEGYCAQKVYIASYNSTSKKFTMKNKIITMENTVPKYYDYRPKFTTMYYYGHNSVCSMSGTTDGWVPTKNIQVFKLISTPYIYLVEEEGVMGSSTLQEFGNSISVDGYNFKQYAFWCLKDEFLSIPTLIKK
jgi:hypothetical protein